MSRKKNKKSSEQGTYALCITVGLVLGLGLGPALDNIVISSLLGALIGAGAGYYFNQRRVNRRKH